LRQQAEIRRAYIRGLIEATGMPLIVGFGIFLFYRENLHGHKTAAESSLR